MHKLPPGSLYRLQTLAQTGASFYKLTAYMRRLEVLGMVVATGRTAPEKDLNEYRITDAGRAELKDRYDPPSTNPIKR
ncbi:hypothetical protein MKK55_23405 [Methylobacterium sp. J-059]|uniref:hypothetical protein n=1 Tax=Methylobacterium sp. J-059 TaxID=2836643 RepID=UPI001FB99FF4|nr:hypothetical protein [Methylobacterium sp. J-059]MCJ2041880.1 hypothetical protein [Methylobacterium sp. J-059]